MNSLRVQAVSTPIFQPGHDLLQFVVSALESSRRNLEGCCLVISSKIVSLAESRLVPKVETSKAALIQREADQVLMDLPYGSILTIKHGLLIASAGIDESLAPRSHRRLSRASRISRSTKPDRTEGPLRSTAEDDPGQCG